MTSKSRKWWIAGLGVALLAFLLYRSRHALNLSTFSGEKLWHSVSNVNPLLLLLSIVLIYLCYFVRAIRWMKFQQRLGPAHLSHIYQMTLAGFSAIFLLGRAGELVRPWLISRKDRVPPADSFGVYALERIFDTASTAVLAVIGLLIFTSLHHGHPEQTASAFETAARTAGLLLCAGVLVAVAFLIYLRVHGSSVLERRLDSWHHAGGWRAGVARTALGFISGIQSIRTWSDLFWAVFLSGLHWFGVSTIYYLIPLAFGGKLAALTYQDALIVLVFTLVGSALQLPGVGGGSQALTIVAYTSVFNIDKEPAVAAALVLWLITFASCSLAGVPLLIREGLSLGELKRIPAEEEHEIDAEITAHAAGSAEASR